MSTRRRKPPAGPQPTTIRDVARAARVSTATVSRVLAGVGVVSPALAERVGSAARKLNYRPNRVARSLRARNTRAIGVLIPNIQNPFFTSVIRGIEDVIHGSDYTLLLGNSDDDAEREKQYLELFRAEGVSGLVLVPGVARGRAYRELLDGGMPVVTIDRDAPELETDSVTVANADGAAIAVRHLLAVGHRRIALITGPEEISTASDRLAGYLTALGEAKLRRAPELIYQVPFRPEAGHDATVRLLALDRRPTAIFAGSDMTALGTLRALHEHRVRVPDDVAVVSFDDMPWAAALQPPLTAVSQPTYDMGATAARLLLDRIREPERPVQRVRLQTTLVVRSSCGAGASRPQTDPSPRSPS